MVIEKLAREDAACREELIAAGNEEAAEIDRKMKEVEAKLTSQGVEFITLLRGGGYGTGLPENIFIGLKIWD